MNIEQYQKFLNSLLKLPWRALSIVILSSFIIATIFSLIVSILIKPDFSKVNNATDTEFVYDSQDWIVETLTQAQIDQILKRNIFNQEGKFPDDDNPEDEENKEGPTKLPLVLLGIISGGTIYNGIAIIKNTQKNSVDSYQVDDLIQPFGVPLIEIYPRKIYLNNNNRREYLVMNEKPLLRSKRIAKQGGEVTSFKMNASTNEYRENGLERVGNAIRMDDTFRQNLLTSQLPQILQDAKAEPHMVGGEVVGWKMVNIKKNSIYEKLGMQNGDIVREINGTPLTDAGKAIKTLNKMRNENKYQVKIERSGASVDLELNVSGG